MGDTFDLLLVASQARTLDEFLQTLDTFAQRRSCEYLVVCQADQGGWRRRWTLGAAEFPTDLLADALDSHDLHVQGRSFAAPLLPNGSLLLAGHMPRPLDEASTEALRQDVTCLQRAASIAHGRERDRIRIERLQAILEIAARWNCQQDMEGLLTEIAEASTQLIHAERASILLWDRANQVLVGRPALGVAEGELRVSDAKGVVGQVVRGGQPVRVAAGEPERINREVDQQLGFHTRNVLCVPLVGKRGKLLGAFELLNKHGGDFSEEDQAALIELAAHAAIALENTQEYERLIKAREQAAEEAIREAILIGECPAIEALHSTVRRVADTDLAVLLLGENGTGKEVVARRIHYLSRRRAEPFVPVNCAAISETLLESELFGHERGAFTDAHAARPGKFELAAGGTLFLDEIGDMSLAGQAKLLRVLEEKLVVRVGGSNPISTDARVIAATNHNLVELVREKRFREDLFFRLNVVSLELPPLRSRAQDVLLLAKHFLEAFSMKAGRPAPRLTSGAESRLLRHDWPGNVRELRNLMERIAYLSPKDRIDVDELTFVLPSGGSASSQLSLDYPLAEATRRFQMEYIRQQLEHSHGNMTVAAERLGVHRSNLYRKMHQLGMPTSDAQDAFAPR